MFYTTPWFSIIIQNKVDYSVNITCHICIFKGMEMEIVASQVLSAKRMCVLLQVNYMQSETIYNIYYYVNIY